MKGEIDVGNFYTSTQILNEQPLSKDDFLKKFCEAMKREGYAVCETGEGEKEYSFSFSDEKGCRWATLYSESYEEGNQTAKADTARIAGMLGTFCINTTVIDSDCAILELYDKSGSKVDNLIMGRADDYFGDNIPEPERALWEPLLNNGVGWEKLLEIVHGDYVFVEEGLAKLSGVLNNGSMFSEVLESDCIMAFEKARPKIVVTNNKPEKKLTVYSAFKFVFGEKLKAYGFFEMKNSKYGFGRLIGAKVLQVVTVVPEKVGADLSYSIYGGIVTAYRESVNIFEKISCSMDDWLLPVSYYYFNSFSDEYEFQDELEIHHQMILHDASNTVIMKSMENSFEYFRKWLLPEFESMNSLFDTAIFLLKYKPGFVRMNKKLYEKGIVLKTDESRLILKIKEKTALIRFYEERLKKRNDFYQEKLKKAEDQIDVKKYVDEFIEKISLIESSGKYILNSETIMKNEKVLTLLRV